MTLRPFFYRVAKTLTYTGNFREARSEAATRSPTSEGFGNIVSEKTLEAATRFPRIANTGSPVSGKTPSRQLGE
jgi:hypothetical protein